MSIKLDITNKRVLRLTLHKKAFEVMVTGEKTEEYRKPSVWINSRLYQKKTLGKFLYHEPKEYDLVIFTNGYGKDKPYFIAQMINHSPSNHHAEYCYSNGLQVEVTPGMHIIKLGNILEVGNYENTRHTGISTNGCHTAENNHDAPKP